MLVVKVCGLSKSARKYMTRNAAAAAIPLTDIAKYSQKIPRLCTGVVASSVLNSICEPCRTKAPGADLSGVMLSIFSSAAERKVPQSKQVRSVHWLHGLLGTLVRFVGWVDLTSQSPLSFPVATLLPRQTPVPNRLLRSSPRTKLIGKHRKPSSRHQHSPRSSQGPPSPATTQACRQHRKRKPPTTVSREREAKRSCGAGEERGREGATGR